MRGLSSFKKSLIVFAFILFVFQVGFLSYVYNTLVQYEEKDVSIYLNKYLNKLTNSINNENLNDLITLPDVRSPYEEESFLGAGYKELLNGEELIVEKTNDETKYNIYAGKNLLFTLLLDNSNTKTKLGLLKLTDWDMKDILTYSENGLYSYDIYVSSDVLIKVNGKDILEDDLVSTNEIGDIKHLYKYPNMLNIKHYKVDKLTRRPEITGYDQDGNQVNLNFKDDIYYYLNISKYNSLEEANVKLNGYNPLDSLKCWNSLLTNDASFQSMSNYLIPGSDLYNKAYTWSTSIDRWFTSPHHIEDKMYSNESLTNFVFYGNDIFSVEAKMTKTLYLNGSNEERVNEIHDRLYFIKYEGTYKLVEIQSLMQ